MEKYLHAGIGECILRPSNNAVILHDSLMHFDGIRYDLGEFIIMPNHVHVILKPYQKFKLEFLLGNCKRYFANRFNKKMGRKGRVWAEESYDHIIRDGTEMKRIAKYIRANPCKAGLDPNKIFGGGNTADWICDLPERR